jgi:hypothetical protein
MKGTPPSPPAEKKPAIPANATIELKQLPFDLLLVLGTSALKSQISNLELDLTLGS